MSTVLFMCVHFKKYINMSLSLKVFFLVLNDIANSTDTAEQIISKFTSNRIPLLILWGQYDQVRIIK